MRNNSANTINPGTASHIDDTTQSFAGRSGSELFLAHSLFVLNRWHWIVSNLSTLDDMRIVPTTRSCIVTIRDRDVKNNLLRKLNSDLRQVAAHDKSQSEKNEKILEVCNNALSIVYDQLFKEYDSYRNPVILPMVQLPTEEDSKDADSLPTPDTDS